MMAVMASQRQKELNYKLWDAAERGDIDILRSCISKGGDVNYHSSAYFDSTPLHIAAWNGRDAVVKILLENNCNIHSVNVDGNTALHLAARTYRVKDSTIQLLINNGADPSLPNKYGDTALHSAAYWGRDSTVGLLINNGADPSLPNINGDTALHKAALSRKDSTIQLLIDNGANLSLPNKDGNTALHLAARTHWIKDSTIQLLINNGANPSLCNNDGMTAQDIAKKLTLFANPIATSLYNAEYTFLYNRGMKEGFINVILKQLTLLGPPCVGKTSFLKLLFNLPAPKSHHSTSIISKPIRATEQIMDVKEGKVWTIIDYHKLLLTLSDGIRAIKHSAPDDHTTTYIEHESFDDDIRTSSTTPHSPIEAVDDTASSTTVNEVVDADVPKPKPVPVSNQCSKDLIGVLKKTKKKPTQSDKATWIHALDSGGQPQFADISRVFIRGNALNVIVMKLTDNLHDKPAFTYSINGKAINVPGELQMSNLQLIEHLVRSISCSRNTAVTIQGKEVVTKPMFIVVGSCLDKIKRSERETLVNEKNAEILTALVEFRDQFIFHGEPSDNDLIFPVDNLCWYKRKSISSKIRERIMSQANIGLEAAIPIRWYMYELHLKEHASKEDHGMISLESCLSIASSLNMDERDTNACIRYLDSLTLCLHYRNLLPNVIFTNPQYLVDLLSTLICLSFVDKPLPIGHSFTSESQRLLREDGIFTESLLDSLCFTFVPELFDKADFLKLLQHLHIIAPLQSTDVINRFFIPIVLPPHQLTIEDKIIFKKTCEPLLITFDNKLIPKGLFPTLIVSLLCRSDKPKFFIDSRSKAFPRQLRYAVKLYSDDLFGAVLLVDRFDVIEVYYTGLTKHCFHLREVIISAVYSSADILAYDVNINSSVACVQNHVTDTKLHPITVSKGSPLLIGCSVETELPPLELTNERQSCWLIEPVATTVPTTNVLPDGPLNESHLPIILYTLSDLVDNLDVVGIFLGVRNALICEIKISNHYQMAICRKDILSTWIATGTATRKHLISSLKMAKENCLANEIDSLPTH